MAYPVLSSAGQGIGDRGRGFPLCFVECGSRGMKKWVDRGRRRDPSHRFWRESAEEIRDWTGVLARLCLLRIEPSLRAPKKCSSIRCE